METHPKQSIVRHGTWLYAGSVASPVRIIKQDYDFLHEIEKADSQLELEQEAELNDEGFIYYVIFKACENSPRPWWVDSQGFKDIESAMAHAESRVAGGISWD